MAPSTGNPLGVEKKALVLPPGALGWPPPFPYYAFLALDLDSSSHLWIIGITSSFGLETGR